MKRMLTAPLVAIAIALLLTDMFFVAAEMMHRMYRFYGHFPWFWHEGWRADPDGSFAEIWGYAKAVAAGLMLVALFRQIPRASVLLATAALFFTVALDDMLQIHEIGGGMLARALDLSGGFGLRGQDVGELMIWALLGLPLLLWILVGYRRSSAHARGIVHAMVIPFALLLFFAVGVDLFLILTVGWEWHGRAIYLVSLLEVAGELFALTLVALVPAHHLLSFRRGEQ